MIRLYYAVDSDLGSIAKIRIDRLVEKTIVMKNGKKIRRVIDVIVIVNYILTLQISPVEVEGVIRQHPGVLDVAVTGIPDPECGELPVALVVPKPGVTITAHEIKDLVKGTIHCLSILIF